MNFLSNLKNDFAGSGVTLSLQIPGSVNERDPGFDAVVSVTNNSDAPKSITQITVDLMKDTSRKDDFHLGQQPNNINQMGPIFQKVASVADTNAFTLNPGENRSLTITVPLNIGNFAEQALPNDNPLSAIAGIFGKVETVANALDKTNDRHFVQASATIENERSQPSAQQDIQLIKPDQFGKAINI